ncbi:MAG: hypothetical protein A2406_02130 [Candidatus Komeilibacteria bacterium RIFOXYC1_FULL_37_11]|uniref:PDZ domain-containing protein n=1 Tax=Candidatus Komeilibacteria bacterium RIFOXYC1_FULL_37_11 TaxID=1798555 RepID=A0A1G2BYQ4_9BACT|nr:MAG: hypothetical protein A2406_02130 [Candidatus Komeilibacteria bacterium RIFOXYC1_FULL_37_11]
MDQFSTSIQPTNKDRGPWWKKPMKFYTYIFLLVVIFIIGLSVGSSSDKPQDSQQVIQKTSQELKSLFANRSDINVGLFEEVWNILHDDYLDKASINDQDLFYGAVAGMVDALGDSNSTFFDPEITEEFTRELDGTFFGIGAEIGRRDDVLVIIAPLADSPAEQAGLKSGDIILAIDGQDTSSIASAAAAALIRGEEGSEVVLNVYTKGSDAAREIKIIRQKIDIPSVIYNMEDDIAIVKITHFNDDTDERFEKVAQQILKDNPSGLIVDVRNNPGGFLNIAVEIASYWLEPGQVVVRETFSDKRKDQDYSSVKRSSLAHLKTIILVNEGSASASEIVAGALQDYKLAKVVGMVTFGKGSVQQLIDLEDKSSIKLTVARWLTPNGRTIEGQGISPDYEVDLTVEDYENERDPQLDKAKELILE